MFNFTASTRVMKPSDACPHAQHCRAADIQVSMPPFWGSKPGPHTPSLEAGQAFFARRCSAPEESLSN